MLTATILSAQHVVADDLPLPELPSVISTTVIPSHEHIDGARVRPGITELPLQYSIEEEDGGNSQPSVSEATDPDRRYPVGNSDC